MTRPGLEPGTY